MIKKTETIANFISDNQTNEFLPSYFDKLYENLKDLNNRSEKYTIGLILIIFLHLIFGQNTIESFSIGPINIKDISIIPKVLPILIIYAIFNLYSIQHQKNDLINALKVHSFTFFKQKYTSEDLKNNNKLTYITRLFLPYSFSNMVTSLLTEKPSKLTSAIGFIILLPTIALGLLPFAFLYQMLESIFNKYYNDTLGFISFWLSIWVFVLTIFYIVINAINESNEEKKLLEED